MLSCVPPGMTPRNTSGVGTSVSPVFHEESEMQRCLITWPGLHPAVYGRAGIWIQVLAGFGVCSFAFQDWVGLGVHRAKCRLACLLSSSCAMPWQASFVVGNSLSLWPRNPMAPRWTREPRSARLAHSRVWRGARSGSASLGFPPTVVLSVGRVRSAPLRPEVCSASVISFCLLPRVTALCL